jgi:hypothetical protein
VSGTVTLTANATDNVKVVGVQFSVDGVNLGSLVTSLPYSTVWDTTTTTNGGHNLRALASDPAGNTSTAEILVTVTNSVPTMTYNLPPNGGLSFQTTDPAGNQLAVSHARFVLNTGSAVTSGQTRAPSAGVAIVGSRQNAILVSETTVPATTLITSGRIYAEIQGSVTTGIAFSNSSPQDAQISFYFTDVFGTDFASGTLPLPAYTQVSEYLNKAPFNGPSNLQGTFTFTSTTPIGAVALRGFTNERAEFISTTLPVSPLVSAPKSDILPQFADGGGWTTNVLLTNTSTAPQSGTVQFFEQGSAAQAAGFLQMTVNGMTGSSFDYWLPPGTSTRLATAGANPAVQAGSVRIQSLTTGDWPVALAVLSFRNRGVTVSESSVFGIAEGNTFRMYMEASGVPGQIGSIQSGVAIANPSDTLVTASIELTRLDGSSLGLAAGKISVPARGEVTQFINEIFPGLSGNFQGIAKLKTLSNVAVAAFRGRYNERGDFLFSTTPPLDETTTPPTELIFPHIVNGLGYSTQLALFGQPGTGRLYLYSQTGTQQTSANIALQK